MFAMGTRPLPSKEDVRQEAGEKSKERWSVRAVHALLTGCGECGSSDKETSLGDMAVIECRACSS